MLCSELPLGLSNTLLLLGSQVQHALVSMPPTFLETFQHALGATLFAFFLAFRKALKAKFLTPTLS